MAASAVFAEMVGLRIERTEGLSLAVEGKSDLG